MQASVAERACCVRDLGRLAMRGERVGGRGREGEKKGMVRRTERAGWLADRRLLLVCSRRALAAVMWIRRNSQSVRQAGFWLGDQQMQGAESRSGQYQYLVVSHRPGFARNCRWDEMQQNVSWSVENHLPFLPGG